jgi:hypothetical protein
MKLNVTYLFIAFVLIVPVVCPAQDFVADVVYVAGKSRTSTQSAANPDHSPSKIYVSSDKIRLENHGTADTILLVNEGEQTAFVMYPAKKEYEPLVGRVSEYFRVKDAENACADWQGAAAEKITCEKVGHEVVDGRQTVKYLNKTASDVSATAVWIDANLKFVIKWESPNIGVELHNIKEAQQTAELFSVPADYEVPQPKKGSKKGFSKKSR